MTVIVNSRGQIVLRAGATDVLRIKPGDVLVAARDASGRIVLQRRRAGRRSYLTPRALSAAARARLYTVREVAWDQVEAEAAARGRRGLAGRRLEEL
jgi:bifunctional DNA-binding transcriptional regulator/antitoxin component of YhaV-PrlF toxin-antitoxin module